MLYRLKNVLASAKGDVFWLDGRESSYRNNFDFVMKNDAAAVVYVRAMQENDDAMAAEFAYQQSAKAWDLGGIRASIRQNAPKYEECLWRVNDFGREEKVIVTPGADFAAKAS